MIIFHEGMPRQGKSYAAMADHIIPALQKGRRVYARIDGLDHAKIAEVAGISEEQCRGLLVELSEEQVRQLVRQRFDKDALIVLDELQNYWPQNRRPLDDEMRKWIAEHGHHGWDVLCMGQVLSECHKTWVNRTNRKIQFQKKDVLGKPNEYKWTMFLGKPDQNGVVKFTEVSKGDSSYDEKYFGCYKSHSKGTENTATYTDDRVVIWNHPIFKKWLPIFGVFLLASVGYMVFFFNSSTGSGFVKESKPVKVTETVTTSGPGQPEKTIIKESTQPVKVAQVEKPSNPFDLPDLVGDLSKEHKIRLAYILRSAKSSRVGIEWRDSSLRVVESLDIADIEALGWRVLVSTSDKLVLLVSGDRRLVATSWPIEETVGKVTGQQTEEIRGVGRPSSVTVEKVALQDN